MTKNKYPKLKLTTFAVGGTNSSTKFNTDVASEKAQRTSFDYLAIGLPLGKFGVAFDANYAKLSQATSSVGAIYSTTRKLN